MQHKTIFLPNYTLGVDAYHELPNLTAAYGRKVVFIGGKTALEKASLPVKQQLEDNNFQVLGILWYGGEAALEHVKSLKQEKSVQESDIIFAFGGGKAIDTCKVLSDQLQKPLFVFPTIASTCASITSVCAIYTANGSFDSLYWRKKPAEHTFINTRIIAEAPVKYLWAGIGDTLAKGYEPEFSSRGRELDYYNSLGIALSKLCQQPLVKYGEQALKDVKEKKVSKALEETILSIIINTGLVSNHVINDYNSCLAHALCYGFSGIPKVESSHLHGEIVSYGVLVQLILDQQFKELEKLLPFYKAIRLPTSYQHFHITWEDMEKVFEKALSVNDIKVASIPITKEKIQKAMEDLEQYIEKNKLRRIL